METSHASITTTKLRVLNQENQVCSIYRKSIPTKRKMESHPIYKMNFLVEYKYFSPPLHYVIFKQVLRWT